MVHFLGSDVHKQFTIYPEIPNAIHEIKTLIGEDQLYELTKINPDLVLNNKKIEIEEPKHFKLSFKDAVKMNLKKT